MKKYESIKVIVNLFIEDVITASVPDDEENFIKGEEIFTTNR